MRNEKSFASSRLIFWFITALLTSNKCYNFCYTNSLKVEPDLHKIRLTGTEKGQRKKAFSKTSIRKPPLSIELAN